MAAMITGGTKKRNDRFWMAATLMAASLPSFMPAALQAQEAAPDIIDSPPELRDFKLEPDKPDVRNPRPAAPPRPQTSPQTSPLILPEAADPPATSSRRPTAPRPQAAAERSAPIRTPAPQTNSEAAPNNLGPQAPAPAQSSDIAPKAANQPSDDVAGRSDIGTEAAAPLPETAAAPAGESANAAANAEAGWPLWEMIAVLMALALAGIAVLFWRRRSTRSRAGDHIDDRSAPPAPAPTEPVRPASSAPPETPLPRSLAKPLTVPAFLSDGAQADSVTPAEAPILDAAFTPIKATISLANLTIKGALKLTNNGETAARNITLRTSIISASEDQEQAIAAFHAGSQPPPNSIGDAAAAEIIQLEIDLIIPLHELKTYALQERRLFVPIVLVNIGYGPQAARQELRLSCLIGREAVPPQPKMAPFRLDLGPRSFAPLGQRPLLGPMLS
ncbi:hypothetical protein ACFOWX_12065 [Sphingorhabdus arenilitoris]|uniref:LPXTG cell wall anchor domain-containing protein n=1 Tax=Sphingorhabdus arenilitoris TaxID=1490041 RepID=A0ABV8RJR6_9SPHN